MSQQITTEHLNPPIPIRDHDWVAYYDPESSVKGYGKTEQEAIEELKSL